MDYSSNTVTDSHEGRFPNTVQEYFQKNYLRPDIRQIKAARLDILKFLSEKRVALVIPMKEQGPVIRSLLETIAPQMPHCMICVVNDGSGDNAVGEVRRYGKIRFVDRNEVLNTLAWDRLMPILNLQERPKGKGITVLAGYLFHFFLAQYSGHTPQWIFQHDADIVEYVQNRGLEYLVWAVLYGKRSAHHIKMAQSGRGNESSMAMRSALLALSNASSALFLHGMEKIEKRAHSLFTSLAPLKWMLSGQFGLSWQLAMQRPFASGYLEETLTCAFVGDSGLSTVQVSNPNICLDAVNDYRKEGIILQLVNNFILTLAFVKKPVHRWTVSDIQSLNSGIMTRALDMALIPPDHGPVLADTVPSERILPSIKMLKEENLINEVAAMELVKRICT